MKIQYSTDNIRWNTQKKQFKYQKKNRFTEVDDEEQQHEEDLYAGMCNTSSSQSFHQKKSLGLDPDYVEYLKEKRMKEFESEQALTTEQKQSEFLSIFINSKNKKFFFQCIILSIK